MCSLLVKKPLIDLPFKTFKVQSTCEALLKLEHLIPVPLWSVCRLPVKLNVVSLWVLDML